MPTIKTIAPNCIAVRMTVPDREVLFSYGNPVAVRNGGNVYKTDRRWSRTTAYHVKAWLNTLGTVNVRSVTQTAIEQLAAY